MIERAGRVPCQPPGRERTTTPPPLALSGLLGASATLTTAPVAVADTEPGKYAVTGTVTDGQGRLLDGTVSVSRFTGTYWNTFLADPIADGKIGLALAPGQYRFHFVDAQDSSRWEYYDNTQDWNASAAVTVTDADVALNPVVLELQPMISGRVVDTTGRPVSGMEVRALRRERAARRPYSYSTRPDGTFRFSVPAGDWKLQLWDSPRALRRRVGRRLPEPRRGQHHRLRPDR